MIRVGLPEWTRRLDDGEVSQITSNIVDLLRGQEAEDPLGAGALGAEPPALDPDASMRSNSGVLSRPENVSAARVTAVSCRSPSPLPPYHSSASGLSASIARASGYCVAS